MNDRGSPSALDRQDPKNRSFPSSSQEGNCLGTKILVPAWTVHLLAVSRPLLPASHQVEAPILSAPDWQPVGADR